MDDKELSVPGTFNMIFYSRYIYNSTVNHSSHLVTKTFSSPTRLTRSVYFNSCRTGESKQRPVSLIAGKLVTCVGVI